MLEPWAIHGRFIIDAESEQEAQRALAAIERATRRVAAAVTVHVHASEAVDPDTIVEVNR